MASSMDVRRLLSPLVAAWLIAQPATVLAAQMGAGDDPAVSGPLSTRDDLQSCKKKKEKTARGHLIARFKVCSGYYLFDPDREDSTASNYGAYWLQLNVDATRRWCARSVKLILPLPATAHAKAPAPGTKVKAPKNKRYTTRLEVDAQGHTSDPAKIKNSFIVRPEKLRSEVVRKNKKLRLLWAGSSTRKLAMAAGIELSWDSGAAPPGIRPRVLSSFAHRHGHC
jgi:hypothetical protein